MKKKFVGVAIACLCGITVYSNTLKVSNIDEFNLAVSTVQAGDSIVLSQGIWKDVKLVLKKIKGTAEQPITITVAEKGKTFLEGASSIHFSGEYIHISGLIFQNGNTANKFVIEFKTGSTAYANNSIVSECVIKDYNPIDKTEQTSWVSMWGKKNTVEHCYFAGKTNQGTTFIVWPNDSLSQENEHHIYRNYFGYRKPLGANGGETIRIGTSQVSKSNSHTIVEGNYFEHCDGEVEIISVKSCENKIINNTFFECEGSLVLRHGDRNVVYGNFFNGNNKKNTGGVRIVNEGHRVYNNYFYKLRGTEFRSAVCLMNGIYNSALNGYNQVKNVWIGHNTIVDCTSPFELCVGKGSRDRDAKPENTIIENNIVYCPAVAELIKTYDTNYDVTFQNNILFGSAGINKEVASINIETKFWNDCFVPTASAIASNSTVTKDLREVSYAGKPSWGAFGNLDINSNYQIANKQNCGPTWYTPTENTISKKAQAPKIWKIEAGTDILYKALRKAQPNDIFILENGTHICTKKMLITQNTIIRAAENAKPVLSFESESSTVIGFEVGLSARLELNGLTLCGDKNAVNPAKYCFAANKENAGNYAVTIDNCEIYGFNVENGGAIFKSYAKTFADSIIVRNSYLHDSFRGFALAEEKEEKGLYNAEIVLFENTVFDAITQWAIDYNRLGIDESTSGGSLLIDHCVFNEVNDREDQTILRQKGIKNVNITNCIFANSLSKHVIRLIGCNQKASNCNVYLSGKISTNGGAQAENITDENPKFNKKAFTLSAKSPLIGKASDGGNIGLK